MPQISRRPLPKHIQEKMDNSLYEAVSVLKKKEEVIQFIGDLLTKTEKVMIPKRFAIAILLSKGWTFESIKDRLKVTQSTITSVAKTLEFSGGYRKAIEKLEKSENSRDFWQEIERLHFRTSSQSQAFVDEELIKKKLGHDKKTLV